MDPITGGLIMGGANLLGSVFATNQNNQYAQQNQQEAEAFDERMIQQQQNYETNMSNSAYQRASQDMQKAGLNPALMFGSGGPASTPSTGAPTIQPMQKTSAVSNVGPAIQGAIQSATALKTANATIDNLVAQNAQINADTKLKEAQRFSTDLQGDLNASLTRKNDAQTQAVNSAMPSIVNAALTAKNQLDMNAQVRAALDKAGFAGQKSDQILSPITNIVNSAVQAKKAFNPVRMYPGE